MTKTTLSSVDYFEDNYPETLPTRLGWLEKELGVYRSQMLFLLGLRGAKAAAIEASPWNAIVSKYELEAKLVEQSLTQYLGRFDYDFAKAKEFARVFNRKLLAGEYSLINEVPTLLMAKSKAEKDFALRSAALGDDASYLVAMAKIIGSEPFEKKGKRPAKFSTDKAHKKAVRR